MAYHEWGDNWEHWDELYKAQDWITKMFKRTKNKYLYSKEKYGTIRYEFTYLWLNDEGDRLTFKKIIRRAVRKFLNVAGELVNDLSKSSRGYFSAWCAGILWVTPGSCWSTINGVEGFYFDGSTKKDIESWV